MKTQDFSTYALVPTPSLRSEVLRASALSLVNLRHSSAISSLFSFFSVIKLFSHLFSISNCPIRASSAEALSVISLAVFSRFCSRCFFLTRKRALAAVFRRRLSSSAASREASSSPLTRLGSRMASIGRFSPGLGPPRVEAGVPMLGETRFRGENEFWDGASVGAKPENPENG